MNSGAYIRDWRAGAGVSIDAVARHAGLPVERVAAIEAGSHPLLLEDAEVLARALGLKTEAFFGVEATVPPEGADPIRTLMKSAEAFAPTNDVRLRVLSAARAALDLLELRIRLGVAPKSAVRPQTVPIRPRKRAFEDGDSLAKELRKQAGISGPIASVRDFALNTLGIALVGARLSDAGPDAFTVYAPGKRAAIVVNLSGKNTNHLVRRFSIAHEICHGQFDRPANGPAGFACRQDQPRAHVVEKRANAFAMRLLMPERDLKRVGKKELLEPTTFRGCMLEWGVHLAALELYASNVFGMKLEDVSDAVGAIDTTPGVMTRDAEELEAERQFIPEIAVERSGELLRLVAHSYSKGLMSRGEARDLLFANADFDLDSAVAKLGIIPVDQSELADSQA